MSLLRLDIDDRQVVHAHRGRRVREHAGARRERGLRARRRPVRRARSPCHNPAGARPSSARCRGLGDAPACSTCCACSPTTRSSASRRTGRAARRPAGAPRRLHEFVEGLYDFWRRLDRFMVCAPRPAAGARDTRPLRVFNRDGRDARRAGARPLPRRRREHHRRRAARLPPGRGRRRGRRGRRAAASGRSRLATASCWPASPSCATCSCTRRCILDPPTNTRTGRVHRGRRRTRSTGSRSSASEWICYPALVGPLVVFVYFHQRFIGLGLRAGQPLRAGLRRADRGRARRRLPLRRPAGGAGPLRRPADRVLRRRGRPACWSAPCPLEDRFGYFGYLKKMVLTLHNVAIMERGRMPFHGAFARLVLRRRPRAPTC